MSSMTYRSSRMSDWARRAGSTSRRTQQSVPESQSTTHENPQLQGNEFPCFSDGDVVISLSPAPSDTLILHSDRLSAFSEIFRVGLDEPWSSNKIAGLRTVNGQDIVMKRYELDFAPESESESEGVFASLVSDVGRISLYESEENQELEHSSDAEGLDSDEESHSTGTPMLLGKNTETPKEARLQSISGKVSHDIARRIILTNKIAFALMYDQRLEISHLSREHVPIILVSVMEWLDLYICSKRAVPIWADRLSAAVLSSKEDLMLYLEMKPFHWLLAGHKVRSQQIYQAGLRHAVGEYLRWRVHNHNLMLRHLGGEQRLLDVVEKESKKIIESVKRLAENLQVLAAGYTGKGVQTHLPTWMKHTQVQKDANLVWLHWLRSVLLESDPHTDTSSSGYRFHNVGDYGSNYSKDGELTDRSPWLLPQEARRLSNGEVHEEELVELWKARADELAKLSSISYDDSLRRELAKVLGHARHRVRVLFEWHRDTTTTLSEKDDRAIDTFRCVDFRHHKYSWETENDWPTYRPMVGQQEDSHYWPQDRMDYYDGSDEEIDYHYDDDDYSQDSYRYDSDEDRRALD